MAHQPPAVLLWAAGQKHEGGVIAKTRSGNVKKMEMKGTYEREQKQGENMASGLQNLGEKLNMSARC